MIEVQTPDGIVEFPDGTPREVMNSALRKRYKPVDAGTGLAANFAQGLTSDFGDELAGLEAGSAAAAYKKGGMLGAAASLASNLLPGVAPAKWALAAMSDPQFGQNYQAVKSGVEGTADRYAQQHPWPAFGARLVGGAVPMVATGGGLAAARSLPQAVVQGAKLGGAYGVASGVGSGESLDDRLGRGIIGGATGAVTGGLIGGGAKVAQDVVNVMLPYLKQGAAAVRSPEQLAMRDIARDASRDNIDLNSVYQSMTPQPDRAVANATPQAVVARIIDRHAAGASTQDIANETGVPASTVQEWIKRFTERVAPRYEGQNLLETLVTPKNGEVVTAPNLTATAKYAANTEGTGRAQLMTAIRQRQADEADAMAQQVDKYFGSQRFDEHVAQVKGDTRTAAQGMYGDLEDRPLLAIANDASFARLRQDPLFEKALSYAQRDAKLRDLPFPGGDVYTPRTIDLVQRQLRRASESLGDPNEAYLARMMRQELLSIADKHIEGFSGVRGFYRSRMLREEALTHGRSLGVGKGASDAEELQFWRQRQSELQAATDAVKKLEAKLKGAPKSNSVSAQLAAARVQQSQAQAIIADFRASFGQGLKDLLDTGKDANRFLGGMERRKAEARVREILPRKEADRFLAAIRAAMRRRDTANRLYGGSDTQPKTQHQKRMDAVTDVGAGLLTANVPRAWRGVTDLVSAKAREVRANRINELMSDTNALAVRRRVDELRHLQGLGTGRGRFNALRYAPALLPLGQPGSYR